MSQPPSNLPPGLSFARRTTAPVKLPRLDFPRLGGPAENQPARIGEGTPGTATGSPGPGQQLIAFPAPEAPIPGSVTPSPTLSPPPNPTAPHPLITPQPLTSEPHYQNPTPTLKEELPSMMTSSGAGTTIQDARGSAKVIVYGRSGSGACMRAIQDLMERQVSFQYVDVSRDSAAAAHLSAICNGDPVVPVIIHIGFAGV